MICPVCKAETAGEELTLRVCAACIAQWRVGIWGSPAMPDAADEDDRDPSPPDEDDDEVAVDWDENGYWGEGEEGDGDDDGGEE